MNFNFYLEKLESSENFKSFIKENSDAFLCSGFFIIDKQNNGANSQQHLDFYSPSKKNLFSFSLHDEFKKIYSDFNENNLVPQKLLSCNFDFNDIEKQIRKAMDDKDIKKEIQRILISVQTKNKKNFLLCTVFISGLGMIRVDINFPEMEIIHFEKKSFFDVMNVFKKKD